MVSADRELLYFSIYSDLTFPTIFFRAFTRIACVCGIKTGTSKRAEGMKQKRTKEVFNGGVARLELALFAEDS